MSYTSGPRAVGLGALGAVVAIIIVALALRWFAGGIPGPPGRTGSPTTMLPEPSATPHTAATLSIEATVRASCHSIGGCGYFAELHASDTWWKGEFRWLGGEILVADKRLPASLPKGDYVLTLTSYSLSDAITHGDYESRFVAERARCTATFSVAPGQTSVAVRAVFEDDACTLEVLPNASPMIQPGPLVEGVPTSLNGARVLRGQELREAIEASTDATPFLAGGWFQGRTEAPEWFCPYRRPARPVDRCGNGFWLFEHQVGGAPLTIAGGDDGLLPPGLWWAADRPVVVSIHTHDPRCTAEDETFGIDCPHLPVLSAVAWLGPVATMTPSPTPVGTSPPTTISRDDAVAIARSHATGSSLTVRSVEAARFSAVLPGEVPIEGDPWVWAVVFEGGPDKTQLIVIDYVSGAFMESWAPAP